MGSDAYRPEKSHAELIARVRVDAEADAIRHAEDMLDRVFPIVAEARAIAAARLAALHLAYTERRAELDELIGVCTAKIEAAHVRLKGAEEALASAGVPESQLALGPLRARIRPAHVAVAVGAALLAGLLAWVEGGLSPLLAVTIATLCGVAVWVPLSPRAPEPADITAMREARAEAASDIHEQQVELVRHQEDLRSLPGRTLATADDECGFAEKMASAYASAVFSSLPAGALSNGRAVASQPPVAVTLPEWAQELGAAA